MVDSNLKLDSSTLQYFCHLLESGLARINWIRAVDKFCVEQLISCQKCRPIDCRAIKFRAVHPHSNHSWFAKLIFPWKQERSSDLRNKFITYIAEEENCILFQNNQDNEKHDKMQKKKKNYFYHSPSEF